MKNIHAHLCRYLEHFTRAALIVAAALAVLPILTCACAPVSQGEHEVKFSKILDASRAVIQAPPGETSLAQEGIMTDAYGLWHPLMTDFKPDESFSGIPPDSVLMLWLPGVEKDVMRRHIYSLMHQRRELTGKVLKRAGLYLPGITSDLKTHGLPIELACLPMLESAFAPEAVSHAGAAGIWQLMPETARYFGLTVNEAADERFDVKKSTAAASAYLKILYLTFRDWPLALAAYNCGEGTMKRALAKTNTRSLSELTLACRALNRNASPLAEETLEFVPKFVAAAHILTNSDKLGFTEHALLNLEYHSPDGQEKEKTLTITSQYNLEPAQASPLMPGRSKRISRE